MMLMAFTLKNDYMDELERRLRMLQQETVEVGMFDNSEHYDSGFTNVNLFRYIHNGDVKNNMKPRPVLALAFMWNDISKSPLKKDLKKYLSNISRRKTKNDVIKALQGTGEFYRDAAARMMGDSTKIPKNTEWTEQWKARQGYPNNSPFVATGLLKSLLSYRIDGKIWEYGTKG